MKLFSKTISLAFCILLVSTCWCGVLSSPASTPTPTQHPLDARSLEDKSVKGKIHDAAAKVNETFTGERNLEQSSFSYKDETTTTTVTTVSESTQQHLRRLPGKDKTDAAKDLLEASDLGDKNATQTGAVDRETHKRCCGAGIRYGCISCGGVAPIAAAPVFTVAQPPVAVAAPIATGNYGYGYI